jgi:protein transport protein SEC31
MNDRFNRLSWSSHGGSDGVIVGGLEDGGVGFWDASKLIAGDADCLLEMKNVHQGAVKGLQVNPFQPYLVASGAINNDVHQC